jgi:hypothetical protein
MSAAILATGCGAQLTGSRPTAGHLSPASAMAGFIANMLAGRPVAACGYAVPGVAGPCALAVGAEGKGSGSWAIGNTATSGNRAIVDVEYANACMVGSCITNTDPNAGLPHSGLSFGAAFKQAQQAQNYAMACVLIGGRWYVEVGQGG